ncbi:MAG: TauD/TfdA family dioxygenase [Gammaproteobacteria bacterium]|nr:TauD/TfdA family dioxygenase [Gammaproteobacteria bacterium]
MPTSRIEVEPLAGACGAVVHGVDLARSLDDASFEQIERAFLEHQVLFFHDQQLNELQHKAFGRRFGTLNIHPRYEPLAGHPEIFPIRKDPEHTRIVGETWHHDLTHLPEPPLGSVLYALEVPPVGGDTLFASQYAAYEALSDGMKRVLAGLRGVHDNRIQSPRIAATRNVQRTSKLREDANEAEEPECEHPVVITHPGTGRKALYVNRVRTHRIAGMSEDESRPLLEFLFEHSHRPEFTCRFRWRKGSVAFWDNRCVMHKALNDYPGHRRYMNRVTINGSRPH